MLRKHVVVVGSSFAGLTAAIELKQELGDKHDVTVISKSEQFTFVPSLVWVPFGLRSKRDITFDVRGPLQEHDVRFLKTEVTRLSLDHRTVITTSGEQSYDYLLIATGPKPNYQAIPGLGPRGYTQSIMSLPEAERARVAFEKFLQAPGPVVVGGVQGCSCFAPAYEFLFAMAQQLENRGIVDEAPLTYLTAEPHIAHFGKGGAGAATKMTESLLLRLGIRSVTDASVASVEPGRVCLADGRTLPFAYAMLLPPFLGVDAVRSCARITDASGFVRVNDCYQTLAQPEVFAAGAAVSISPTDASCTACGVPKSGYLSEGMARTAARNIAALIGGDEMVGVSPAILENEAPSGTGDSGARRLAEAVPSSRRGDPEWRVLGPEARWAKVAFAKYFRGS